MAVFSVHGNKLRRAISKVCQIDEFEQCDQSFELSWLGPGHGGDLIAVVVPPYNVALLTDVAAPKRLPWQNMSGANIDD